MLPGKRMYGFLANTGELAQLAQNEKGWCLSHAGEGPFFVEDSEQFGRVLFRNTPIYNSEPDLPFWGCFTPEQLTPVAVELHVEAVSIDIPLGVLSERIVDSRDLPPAVARLHSGIDTEKGRRYVGVVVLGDSGTYAPMVGKHVCFGDLHNVRRVDWAGPMPPDWPRYPEDRGDAVLICSVPL